ncbi:RNA polymerase sigma factor [Streptomyces sp. ISL-100]|uniref:RNA polymerase sigma factor n=1 Tax=Streptomyces sp. ISL-100 TaxID=2819173 RepID=UPI001BE533B9|nr:sigma-70 family RNA polymerase sigma factor [Streptomyces sp. ISL-100]MBT2394841.1 sigma-70 family RNA polymerase sigma factor [Streptomyces sp. ISL-100]
MATDMDPSYLASRPGEEAAHLRWQHMWAHREQLLKVARRRSMSAEDAEDAVQEAMLRGAQHTHLDDARMGAWLTTVTMRLCVDRYRQVHREAQVSGTRTLTAPGPVPVEEAVCDRAEARWVAFQSKELPARQAEALRLKSEDRDIGQIASEMDLSYEAVESLLARARRTLRNSLAGTLALGLWLIGRGRDQAGQAGHAGGHAQALAAASAAATLAVVGLVVPFAYEPTPPGPARSGTSEATEDVDTAGYSENPAARSVSPVSPDSPASSVRPDAAHTAARSGKASPTGLPTPLPEVPMPEVPMPKVALPEVSPPLPATPDTPRLPAAPPLPSAPPLPDTTAVPDAVGAVPTDTPTDVPTDVLDEAPHTGEHP